MTEPSVIPHPRVTVTALLATLALGIVLTVLGSFLWAGFGLGGGGGPILAVIAWLMGIGAGIVWLGYLTGGRRVHSWRVLALLALLTLVAEGALGLLVLALTLTMVNWGDVLPG